MLRNYAFYLNNSQRRNHNEHKKNKILAVLA